LDGAWLHRVSHVFKPYLFSRKEAAAPVRRSGGNARRDSPRARRTRPFPGKNPDRASGPPRFGSSDFDGRGIPRNSKDDLEITPMRLHHAARPPVFRARAWEELARLALQPVGGRRLAARQRLERMALLPGHDAADHGKNMRMLSLQEADSVTPSENSLEMSL
jgi:hypothetical protein